jgi:hypothetical protein
MCTRILADRQYHFVTRDHRDAGHADVEKRLRICGECSIYAHGVIERGVPTSPAYSCVV